MRATTGCALATTAAPRKEEVMAAIVKKRADAERKAYV